MGKKIAFLLLAVLLAGCGGNVPGDISTTTAPSTSEVLTTATSTTTTTAPTTVPTTVPTTAPILAGWQDMGGNRYFYVSGVPVTGWQEIEGTQYYFREDGRMARGKVVFFDSETRYFTSSGEEILLVNPWNVLPEDYTVKTISYTSNRSVAEICYEPLCQMIADCEAATNKVVVRSAYRTTSDQKWLFMRRVNEYLDLGYSQEEAELEAGKVVAVPGTSEHQLGLAVDLVDASYDKLNEQQEQTPVQKWLMEHCWKYGFILRYPNEKTEVTGIIYEPWHYRYVGVELAMELKDSGLCLEEYLDQLTQE